MLGHDERRMPTAIAVALLLRSQVPDTVDRGVSYILEVWEVLRAKSLPSLVGLLRPHGL